MNPRPRILIIDDSPTYVDKVVETFEERGFEITGCKRPAEVLGWRARQKFDFDLILLDLELGKRPDGSLLSAQQLLLHLKTYAPSSKVVVITVTRFSVEAAVKCIELGALAVFPKQVEIGELCGLAEVYGYLGDPLNTRQELIDLLWEGLAKDPTGQRLEMLMTNLFESMPTFRVIETNLTTSAGSIDVLVENLNEHDFWKGLSLHVAIECKNHSKPPEPRDFNQLKEIVRSRRRCKTGILVSMSNFTSAFQRRQAEAHQVDDVDIFGLGTDHLEDLVKTSYDKREEYLREVLERQ